MAQPVDATLPESDPALPPAVAASIEVALTARGIACGPLQPITDGASTLNLTLTDHDTVFVKIMRAAGGYERALTELACAQWAADHGVPATLPLLPDPVRVTMSEDTLTAVATAWTYHRIGEPPPLVDQMATGVAYVSAVAALPPPPLPVDRTGDRWFHDRALSMHAECRSPHAEALLERTVSAWETITAAHGLRSGGPVVWRHGDPHVGNLLWPTGTSTPHTFGGSVLIDWEASTVGTGLEADLAQLLRSAWTYRSNDPRIGPTERVGAEAHARTLIRAADGAHGWRLDWSLIDAHLTHRVSGSLSRRVNADPDGDLTRALLGRLGLHA